MAILSSPEIALFDLVSNAGTNAVSRVYPLRIPQDPTYPCFVYSLVSDTDQFTRSAYDTDSTGSETGYNANVSGLNRYQLQLDAYAKTHDASKALIDQVTPYLQGYSGDVTAASGQTAKAHRIITNRQSTGFETGGELYRYSLNVIMWLELVTQ